MFTAKWWTGYFLDCNDKQSPANCAAIRSRATHSLPSLDQSQLLASELNRVNQPVNFFARVVERETGSHGSGDSEKVVQEHRAVMAVPYKYAAPVEQLGQIFGMSVFDGETDNRSFVLGRRPVDCQPRNL
jgi:hypothetical protein